MSIEDKVKEIKEMLSFGKSQRAIAKIYGVSQSAINYINIGKTWRHLKPREDLACLE